MLAWGDIIGRGIRDTDKEVLTDYNGESDAWYDMPIPDTYAKGVSLTVNGTQYVGVKQYTKKPLLDSSMPDWMIFKQINNGYTLYTNGVLNKKGNFSTLEGEMGGYGGTMDQKMSSYVFYEKLFLELNLTENMQYANVTGADGEIQHFDIHYYYGMADYESNHKENPTPAGSMTDNTGARCWPFYLESYGGMAAIQAGHLEDGLEILEHTMLTDLRLDYMWTRNLWNRGYATYMTAPVSWMMGDVLAGAAIDIPNKILTFGPSCIADKGVAEVRHFAYRCITQNSGRCLITGRLRKFSVTAL